MATGGTAATTVTATEAATETAGAQPGARAMTVTATGGGVGSVVVRAGGTGAHTRSPPRPEEGSGFRPRSKAALSAPESPFHICPIAFSRSAFFMLGGMSGLCARQNSW
eukprot:scaffold70028_cov45-Phaeocystis_antarctica.AAC.2